MSKIKNMAEFRSTPDLQAVAQRIISRDEKIIDALVARQVAKAKKRQITAHREYRLGLAICVVVGALLLVSLVVLGVWLGLYLLTGGAP